MSTFFILDCKNARRFDTVAAAAAVDPEQVNVTYYFIILLYGRYPEPYVVYAAWVRKYFTYPHYRYNVSAYFGDVVFFYKIGYVS